MSKRGKGKLSNFYCTQCGKEGIPVWRQVGNEREAGHLKKLWCIFCNKETNHVECKPFTHYEYQNFLQEYYGGNFAEDGSRKDSYKIFKDKLVKENKWEELKNFIEEKNKWRY